MTHHEPLARSATVIVLVWNGEKYLEGCLQTLLAQTIPAFEIIVVDNASTDGSRDRRGMGPRVQLIRNDRNLGFASGNNLGLRAATGEIVVLLNQDTQVQPGWLQAIVDTFNDPTIGIVGCKALYPHGRRLQHAGGMVAVESGFTRHIGWGESDQGQYEAMTEPDYVTGAAFGIRRQVLARLGGLDESFSPAFYEEVDYCYRARRAGFRVVYQPRAVLDHAETTTLPEASYARALAYHHNRVRFVLRHWSAPELEKLMVVERHAVAVSGLLDETVARARAYWENLLATPSIVAQRRRDRTLGAPLTRGESRWLIETLQSLRQQAHQRIAALIMQQAALAQQNVSAPEYASVLKIALPETVDMAGLYTHIEDLERQTVLELPQLQSHVPVLGRCIDGVRQALNAWVLQHYLVPVLQQQTAVNVRLFRAVATVMRATDALSHLHQLQLEDEASVSAMMLTQLEERAPALVGVDERSTDARTSMRKP